VDNQAYAFIYNGSSWSSPEEIDPGNQLFSVSCPTASFCVAVDNWGNVLTYNGSSWSAPDQLSGGGFFSVSCPSTSFCTAMGYNGDVLTYNGTSWSSSDEIDSSGGALSSVSISCASSSFCAVVDGDGNALTYNGSSWSSLDHIDASGSLDSVSCPSASFCAAVDSGSNAFIYNGSSWSSADSIDAGGILSSVSCWAASSCVAVAQLGKAFIYSGSSWSSPKSFDAGDSPSSVSCPSASFCAAVDYEGNALTYNGSSWSSPDEIDPSAGSVVSVSCPTASFCAAVDDAGNIFTYNGSSWSSPDPNPGHDSLLSVSCSAVGFCAAVVGPYVFTYQAVVTLTQASPTSASVADGAGYSGQLTVTNATGSVTYTETSSTDSGDVVVGSTGAITAATSLTPGTYTVSGTDHDTNGDTGTWAFALTVRPAIVTLTQASPTSASVADGAGYSGQLTVTNATGTVSYTETSSTDSGDVVVGSTGAITAATSLTPGTYTVSGTDHDTNGDTGTWSFALTVRPPGWSPGMLIDPPRGDPISIGCGSPGGITS